MNPKLLTTVLEAKWLPGKDRFGKSLFLITILALVCRLIVLFNDHPIQLRYDELDYYQLGINLYEGKGFVSHDSIQKQFQGGKPGEPTAYRTVVLPALLATHFFIFGENTLPPRITLVLLSALCCVLIGRIGRLLHSSKAGLVAALVWALYPPAIISWFSSDRFLTEGLGIFLILASFYFLLKVFRDYSFWPTVIAGLLFGLAVLTRGFLALTIPLIVGYLFFFAARKKFHVAFVFGLFTTIIVGSWIARNYVVMGKPVLSTQTDSFFWGNNEWTRGSVYGDVFNVEPWTAAQVQPLLKKYPGIKNFSEVELSEVWMKEGMSYAKANPGRAFWLWGRKTVIYLLPFQMNFNGGTTLHIVYLVMAIGSLFASWLWQKRREYFLLMLPFFGAWLACLLTIAMDRYRYTIEPFIILTGVIGFIELYNRYIKKPAF